MNKQKVTIRLLAVLAIFAGISLFAFSGEAAGEAIVSHREIAWIHFMGVLTMFVGFYFIL